MKQIFAALADIATELSADRCQSIAARLKSVQGPTDSENIEHAFGANINEELKSNFLRAWINSSTVVAHDIALALESASVTASAIRSREKQQLVWTGPQTSSVFPRETEQVMNEVISCAVSNMFIVSYVFYMGRSTNEIINAINDRVLKGVSVKILLEAPEGELGGTLDNDGMLIMRSLVPNATFLIWNPELKQDKYSSFKVHAKCIVADRKIAFLTSANLTSAALEKNMEAGAKFEGGEIPKQLHDHLDALHSQNVLVPIESIISS